MSQKEGRRVPVTFADGVREDIASLVANVEDDDLDLLKRGIAELLVEYKANPYLGELMGSGRHPELAGCRRVRFDIPTYRGKPRLRLIYRNEPSDGAPAGVPLARSGASCRAAGASPSEPAVAANILNVRSMTPP